MNALPDSQPLREAASLACKDDFRREASQRLRLVSCDEVRAWSARICEHIEAAPVFQRARTVGFFCALPREPDVMALQQTPHGRHITWLLPFRDARQPDYAWCLHPPGTPLAPGPEGVMQPAQPTPGDPGTMDLCLVPGRAFDGRGVRLGRGGGHYDRLLAQAGGLLVGVAFARQHFDQLPAEPHDLAMHALVSEHGWINLPPLSHKTDT